MPPESVGEGVKPAALLDGLAWAGGQRFGGICFWAEFNRFISQSQNFPFRAGGLGAKKVFDNEEKSVRFISYSAVCSTPQVSAVLCLTMR
jgi:hypothetical protein